MRFLIDQDVFLGTAYYLRLLGHDVVRTAEIGLSAESDECVLERAHEESRIFVTRDRDFGALVFVRFLGAGVLYLRMPPSEQDAVHAELARVLSLYSETELASAFVVVESKGHRFRRLPV